jgi:group I intron endonuclease
MIDSDLKRCGVYKITNLKNNKVYIGSTTKTLYSRKRSHFLKLKNNIHFNTHLQLSFNKYGENFFTFEILAICKEEHTVILENFFIKLYSSHLKDKGYNMAIPLELPVPNISNKGKKFSEDHKEKISYSLKRNCYWKNKKQPQSMISKRSEKNKKLIQQICKSTGKILNTWSFEEAKKNGYYPSAARNYIQGKRKSYKGFDWKIIKKLYDK